MRRLTHYVKTVKGKGYRYEYSNTDGWSFDDDSWRNVVPERIVSNRGPLFILDSLGTDGREEVMSACQMGSGGGNEDWYILQHKIVRAAKQHNCVECQKPIGKGEKYELYKINQEGAFLQAETCLDCVSLRDGFFPDGCIVGDIRGRIVEKIYELRGLIDSECILPLTPLARAWVFELIEEQWGKAEEEAQEEIKEVN